MDENETKSSLSLPLDASMTHQNLDGSIENPTIKSEPVCVFVNRNFDSSDSEQANTNDEEPTKR